MVFDGFDTGTLLTLGTFLLTYIVWLIRLEGKVHNTDERIRENETRDKETRIEVKTNRNDINRIDKEVGQNKTEVIGIEKNLENRLASIEQKMDLIIQNFGKANS